MAQFSDDPDTGLQKLEKVTQTWLQCSVYTLNLIWREFNMIAWNMKKKVKEGC